MFSAEVCWPAQGWCDRDLFRSRPPGVPCPHLDNPGVETWDFRCTAHIEVEIAAPQLLNAGRCLPGLERRFDHLQIVLLIGANLLGNGMDHGNEVRI